MREELVGPVYLVFLFGVFGKIATSTSFKANCGALMKLFKDPLAGRFNFTSYLRESLPPASDNF